MQTAPEQPLVKGSHEKFCSECGQLILLKAEICPKCGCRQIPATAVPITPATVALPVADSNETDGSFVGKMAALLVLNVLWNGLGNIAIGDRRGWAMGFLNWVFFILSIFTLFVPMLLFFAVCGYLGYDHLRKQERRDDGWCYAQDGKAKGPFNAQHLRQLVSSGVVTADTPVWRAGLPDWTPANRAPAFPFRFAG